MKFKIYFTTILLLLIFSGCGGDSSTNQSVTTHPSDSELINILESAIFKSEKELKTWYKFSVPNVNGNNKIVKRDGRFLALIDPYTPPKEIATTGSRLIYSEDGINWYDMSVELPIVCSSIIATEDFLYAVGDSYQSSQAGSIIRSSDSYNWEEVYLSKNNLSNLSNIIDRNGILIAVGLYGDIIISKDGYNWEEKNFGNYQLSNISYSDNELIVAGGINILSTKDMENWTLLDNDNLIESTANNLYANGLFLLIDYNLTRIYNGNSFTYIKRGSNLKEVVYEDKFLNLDENASISSDGITWTTIAKIELVDENTTGLNVEKSFISGSDIIFTEKF